MEPGWYSSIKQPYMAGTASKETYFYPKEENVVSGKAFTVEGRVF